MDLEKVKIKRIIGPTPSGAAVLLGNDKKTFVIFIGFYEAAALIREINKEVPARPLTHELIQNVFLGFDVKIKQVIISSIIENTFCATLILSQPMEENGGELSSKRNEVRIDARPSDCFVMALKNKVDLFVTSEVFERVPDVTNIADDVEGSLSSGQLGGGVLAEGAFSQTIDEMDFDFCPEGDEEEQSFLGDLGCFDDEIEDDDEDGEEWKV